MLEKVRTDKHESYRVGVKFAFEDTDAKVEDIADCALRKGKGKNNNRIERMNGALREIVKVTRGWKSNETPITEGQRIAYNFVKTHMALNGKTPAQAAGLKGQGWHELIRLAMQNIKKPL